VRNAMAPAKGGEGLIREVRPHGMELFMDPYQIALALGEQLYNLLPIGLGFFWP
jgi:hypothetical protein